MTQSVIVAGPVPVKVTPPARSKAGLFGGGVTLIIAVSANSKSPIVPLALVGGIAALNGARPSTVTVNEAASAVEINAIAEIAANPSLRVLDSFIVCSLVSMWWFTVLELAPSMPTFMVLI